MGASRLRSAAAAGVALTTAVGVLVLLGPGGPAAADVAISQQVVLRQDHGPFRMRYKQYYPGDHGVSVDSAWGKGRLTFSLKSYKLKEQERRYDYYLVDFTGVTSHRRGLRGVGRAQVYLSTTRRVNYTTYSKGKSRGPKACQTRGINIAASIGVVSVGTTVGHIRTCGTKARVRMHRTSRAAMFTATGLNQMRYFTAQKWVRVRDDHRPRFFAHVITNHDRCRTTIGSSCKIHRHDVLHTFHIGVR
jgi:hypothetical protein